MAGPYAAIPPVVACGGVTNQSYDLTPGTFVLFFGNLTAAGTFTQSLTLYAPWVGVPGSTQAFILDPVNGFVMTEAWDFIIVP